MLNLNCRRQLSCEILFRRSTNDDFAFCETAKFQTISKMEIFLPSSRNCDLASQDRKIPGGRMQFQIAIRRTAISLVRGRAVLRKADGVRWVPWRSALAGREFICNALPFAVLPPTGFALYPCAGAKNNFMTAGRKDSAQTGAGR